MRPVSFSLGAAVVGSEDMHVYAFDAATGRPAWASDKLPGASFRGYHPVIAPDGSVLITVMPAAGGDAIQQVLLDMVKDVEIGAAGESGKGPTARCDPQCGDDRGQKQG